MEEKFQAVMDTGEQEALETEEGEQRQDGEERERTGRIHVRIVEIRIHVRVDVAEEKLEAQLHEEEAGGDDRQPKVDGGVDADG